MDVNVKDFTIPKFDVSHEVKEDDEVIFSEEEWEELPKEPERKVSSAQLNSIAQWARGLRREEAIVVIDNLPLDLIFTKIGQELEKNKKFTEAITSAMNIIK